MGVEDNKKVHVVSVDKSVKRRIPRVLDRLSEELVIALVGPVGSGCTTTCSELIDVLSEQYGYQAHKYKLSDFIKESAHLVDVDLAGRQEKPAERVEALQEAGDKLREAFGDSYLAAKAIERIAHLRDKEGFDDSSENIRISRKLRKVHIIDSIKHKEELRLLRSTYGDIFWLVGVFAPLQVRKKRLTDQQRLDHTALSRIIDRDYREDFSYGQQVRDVFFQADIFIRNDRENKKSLTKDLSRFTEVLFASAVHTPTLDESSMYAAYAEAAKSACLSRQVGAAIVSERGELIGLGRNDVPQFGGGLYSEDSQDDDHRCHAWQDRRCHNDRRKDYLYTQIFEKLNELDLIKTGAKVEDITGAIKRTDAKSLIEYSRAVHAEMDAIISVARTNKSGILGGTLYSTTFPCHSCARHIVASGLNKVVYIEPYPKSLASELHSDAVSEDESDKHTKVLFLQFSGIAPKNILKLFGSGLTRKDENGSLFKVDKKKVTPVVKVSLDDYSTHEKYVVAELAENEKNPERK